VSERLFPRPPGVISTQQGEQFMNIDTGEIKPEAELTKEEKTSGKWASLTIGEVFDIKGVPCKLVHVNHGKRRLTLMPVNALTKVPQPIADPIVRTASSR